MAFKTSILPFDALTPNVLYDVLALRNEVFIVEQCCPYLDIDGQDQQAQHVLVYEHQKLIAYARILAIKEDEVSFGRVAIVSTHRGRGLGRQLVKEMLAYLQTNYPQSSIVICAQCYLLNFYQAFAFLPTGDPFDLDGIPHIWMRKSA